MSIESNLEEEKKRRDSKVKKSREITPRKKLRFEVHLTEHCNLNCKYCFHFSPLAREEYLDLEEYKKDLGRLAELFDGKMQLITLLGGEPLLHPHIIEFVRVTREYFPIGKINILSNGILLQNMSDRFWKTCRETNTQVSYTRYPIHIDEEKIEKKAREFQVSLHIDNIDDGIKKMVHEPIDIKGNQDAYKNFYDCYRSNLCITLKHSVLYTCLKPAHIHIFNEYFHENIPIDERNGINIFQAESGQEILEYLTKPIPMCAYCDRKNNTPGHDWAISKKEKREFVLDVEN